MGLLKRLFGADEPEGGREAVHPGGGFGSARQAMEALIARMRAWAKDREDVWATFTMPGKRDGRRDIVIEVRGDELNMLQEELPGDIVAAAGLERIGDALYRVPGADAKAMADVMDTVLRTHFGLVGNYAVEGKIQN